MTYGNKITTQLFIRTPQNIRASFVRRFISIQKTNKKQSVKRRRADRPVKIRQTRNRTRPDPCVPIRPMNNSEMTWKKSMTSTPTLRVSSPIIPFQFPSGSLSPYLSSDTSLSRYWKPTSSAIFSARSTAYPSYRSLPSYLLPSSFTIRYGLACQSQ